MTDLYNRRFLDDVWNTLIRKGSEENKSLAFFMLDIDYFKLYNDHYGHQKGDDALRSIGTTLNGLIRHNMDFVFRYGGEEFAVILYDADLKIAEKKAEQFVREIAALNIHHTQSKYGHVTLSAGFYVTTLSPSLDPEQIMEKADRALYRAKAQGRNRWVLSELE